MLRSKDHHGQGSRRPPPVDPNMTPMIDVVFLLIIFFLVSSHLAQRENRLELPLPEAATATKNAADETPRLTLSIRADGEVLLGTTPLTHEQLLEELHKQRTEHGERLRVRLRGDREVTYAHIEPLLVACAEAGIEDIGLAVRARSASALGATN